MNDRKKALAIGAFVLGSFSLLLFVLLVLKPTYGDGDQRLRLRVVDLDKIGIGTRVTFAGQAVGQVIAVQPLEYAREHARVDREQSAVYSYEVLLSLDSKIKLYESDRIQAQTSGLMGEKNIAIFPQKAPDTGLVPIDPKSVLYAELAPSLEESLQRVGRTLVATEACWDQLYKIAKKSSQPIESLLTRLEKASRSVETILDQAVRSDFVEKLTDTAQQTSFAMTTLSKSLEPFTHPEQSRCLTELLEHTKNILAALDDGKKIDALFEKSQSSLERWQLLGSRLNGSWFQIEETVRSLQQAAKRVDEISAHVFEGRGSLGKLLMQENLYLDLHQGVARANILLQDINNYGLFFSSNSTWKNQRIYRMARLQSLKEPEKFNRYWQEQIQSIQINIGQLQEMLGRAQRLDPKGETYKEPAFKKSIAHILQSLGDLQEQVSLLTEGWTQTNSSSQATDTARAP